MSAAHSTPPPAPRHSYRPRAFQAGAVVADKYVLIRQLGAGGMGVVWVAHNRVLDVHVALKLIDLESAANPQRVGQRLLQEARAAARLAHPSICRVFDFGQTDAGDPFIVSELLHGETLGDVIASAPRLGAHAAVQLLLPIVEGLAVAHGKGVVHRDVKPENIFLSRDEVSRVQPKLLDFGIARMVDADHKITMDGTLLGTPDYMSPEQARGEGDLDQRTDVWSISVVLYELLALQRPFGGDNYNALLWAIGQEQPPSTVELGVGDAELWAILQRGLAKDRNERWQTMTELGTALARWLLAQGVTEDACGAALRRAWLRGAAPGDGPPSSTQGSASDVRSLLGFSDEGTLSGAATQGLSTGVFAKPPPRRGRNPLLVGLGAFVAAAVATFTVFLVLPLRGAAPPSSAQLVPSTIVVTVAVPVSVAPTPEARAAPPLVLAEPSAAASAVPSASAQWRGSGPRSKADPNAKYRDALGF